MGFFKKKNNNFVATKTFMAGVLQYDEHQSVIKIKNGFKEDLIPVHTINSAAIAMNGKYYNLTDLNTIRNGILSGTYKENISNIKLIINAEKTYILPLSIGKQSADKAERILYSASQMLSFILSFI